MANHINGNRLCVYHEPLIYAMLERFHLAKCQKEANEEIKRDAQREAQERASKVKQICFQVSNVKTMMDENEYYIELPTLMVGVEKATKLHSALLDLGVDANIMSSEVYTSFNNKKAKES